MADEITALAQLTLATTNNHKVSFYPPQLKITQNNAGVFENTVALTTTTSALSITNLTTYGYGFFQNVSASSAIVIAIGADSAGTQKTFGRLKWREFGIMRLNSGTTYRAQCESSSGKLYFGCWED